MIRFAFVWRTPLFKPYFDHERGSFVCFGGGPFRVSIHYGDWHQ